MKEIYILISSIDMERGIPYVKTLSNASDETQAQFHPTGKFTLHNTYYIIWVNVYI